MSTKSMIAGVISLGIVTLILAAYLGWSVWVVYLLQEALR